MIKKNTISFLKYILLFLSISPLNCILLKNIGSKREYCFEKELTFPDSIHFTYLTTAGRKEKIDVVFSNSITHEVIFKNQRSERGEYKSVQLKEGTYMLCFKILSKNTFDISFEFDSVIESGIIKELAEDKEVQQMISGVNELKKSFQEFEKNYKFIVDRRTKHTVILQDIIHSVKNLTFLKIGIIVILGLFQVCVITKFFGPDKRVKSVKGAFQDGL